MQFWTTGWMWVEQSFSATTHLAPKYGTQSRQRKGMYPPGCYAVSHAMDLPNPLLLLACMQEHWNSICL